jgi:hypothetical protein
MDGWMGGKAGLRIAYSNQKQARSQSKNLSVALFCIMVQKLCVINGAKGPTAELKINHFKI